MMILIDFKITILQYLLVYIFIATITLGEQVHAYYFKRKNNHKIYYKNYWCTLQVFIAEKLVSFLLSHFRLLHSIIANF